jgi:hypothetical protein
MNREDKTLTPLPVMLGSGDFFNVKGKNYVVKPIALQNIEEFMTDNLSVGSQLYNMANKKAKAKVDRWLGGTKDENGNVKKGYCFDENGNPVTLERAMADEWDLIDLKEFFRKLCDISG